VKDVWIGTSGWHYPHWRGSFYPREVVKRAWLSYYAGQFDCVEINNSFYRLPSVETLEDWAAQTPESFHFALKAPRTITHRHKLKNCDAPLAEFIDRVGVLGGRCGPLLFQLPPRWHCNLERLKRFLAALPDSHRCTFEFRDQSWHNEGVYTLLREHNAAFCIYHLDGFLSPLETTADFVYVRLHGPGGPYQGSYHTRTLRRWAGHIHGWRRKGLAVHCFFDNDESGYAARNARRLTQLLAEDA